MLFINNWILVMEKISIEILQINQMNMKFALNNCDTSLANALRRVLISQVPTLAPHLVSIIQNTSILHDEWLCQRIGLIPFISDSVDNFKYPWQCACDQGEDCRVCKSYFVLEVKNTTSQIMQVTSLDIREVYSSLKPEEDQHIRPVLPMQFQSELIKGKKIGIPIVKLAQDQQINIRFDVQKGIGKMHAKWCPVSLATFQPDPEIKLDDTIDPTLNEKRQICESCPTKVFQIHDSIFSVASPQRCIFCNECKKTTDNFPYLKNFIRIGKKKDRYIFTIESIGTLPAPTIVKKAISTLRQKLKGIEERID